MYNKPLNPAFDVSKNQPIDFFEFYIVNYRHWLSLLNSKKVERDAIHSKNNEGICDRESIDPDWENHFRQIQEHILMIIRHAECAVDAMPNTPEFIPCKIALKMRYFHGFTNVRTAVELDVSETTVQRLYERSKRYFADYAVDEEDRCIESIPDESR